jgi:hypothetical protein
MTDPDRSTEGTAGIAAVLRDLSAPRPDSPDPATTAGRLALLAGLRRRPVPRHVSDSTRADMYGGGTPVRRAV